MSDIQQPIEICYATLRDDGHTFNQLRRIVVFDQRDLALNPIPPNAVTLTPAEFHDIQVFGDTRKYIDGKVAIVPSTKPYPVPKVLIVERLSRAGLLRTAREGLKMDAPLTDLTDAEILLQEQWNSATQFMSNDPTVRAFLSKINANPDQILADPNLGADVGSHT